MAAHNLKVGDKGTISVKVTRIDNEWVTFTIPGYPHALTMFNPSIEVTEAVTPTRRKKGAQFQEPPE